jgi:ComEC/Rec2-related protein
MIEKTTIDQLTSFFLIIRSSLNNWGIVVQQSISITLVRLSEVNSAYLGADNSQLLISLLFGSSQSLNSSLRHNFEVMGMLHILSASGFNISLVVGMVAQFLTRIKYLTFNLKTILLLLSGSVFFLCTDQGLSMQRAYFMFVITTVSFRVWHRPQTSVYVLLVAGLILIARDQDNLSSLSLQLSVAATGSIIWLQPWLNHCLTRPRPRKNIKEGILTRVWRHLTQEASLTLAAEIGVMPLIWLNWEELNIFTLVANTFLGSLVSFLTILSFAWHIICFCAIFTNWLIVPEVASFFINSFLSFFLKITELAGGVKGLTWSVPQIQPLSIVAWYLAWIGVGWRWRYHQVKRVKQDLLIKFK